MEEARSDKALLGPELFLEIQKICFKEIFDHTFTVLKIDCESRQDTWTIARTNK